MHPIPLIEEHSSERLHFRRLDETDVDAWMEFHASEEALKYFGYPLNDRDLVRRVIAKQIDRYRKDGSGLRAVMLKGSSEIIGLCGLLTQQVNGAEELEIGYQFLPRFWGNGYASESAILCKNVAFTESSVPSIISLIHPDNVPSQAVAKRNGMKVDGETTWHGMPTDIWRVTRNG